MKQDLPTPLEGSCRAYYADGFIYDETALDDVGQYGTKNVFDDIKEKRPEADHGKMVTFSVFHDNKRYDYDFTNLPDNARPIRFRQMEADSIGGDITAIRLTGVDCGYQYTEEGVNRQFVDKLR